ncbi:MAG: hypothetical protein B7Y02_09225, partial [Rhodobacterales bacterium 17-64-5]
RLIERLKRPARVALLGLPGAGKSAILNLLAGTTVVPETLRLPTIVVQHGAQDRMLCTLSDGRTEAIAGHDLAQVLTRNPALVTVERDLPALKVISLLEVSAGPMDAEQRRAAIWASKRADIVIWCTTSYLPKEQVVWESMPDMVKDNGFLFVTKTDLLGSADAATGVLDRIEQRAGEDFRQVFAISAKLARAAMPPGGAVDRDKFRQSGAAAVISTIKARVQAARRADTDTAEVLLARHVEAGEMVARRFQAPAVSAEPVSAPDPGWVPPPDPVRTDVPSAKAEWPEPPEHAAAPEAPPVPVAVAPPQPAVEDDVLAKILAGVSDGASDGAKPSVPDTSARALMEGEPDQPLVKATPAVPPSAPPAEARPAPLPQEQPLVGGGATPGNQRLSDRLRQTPDPNEIAAAASMPLRTTWKSPTEAAERRPVTSRPPPAPPVVRRDVERSAAMRSTAAPLAPPAETNREPDPEPAPAPEAPAFAAPQPTAPGAPMDDLKAASAPADRIEPAAVKAAEPPASSERVSVFAARKPAAEARPAAPPPRAVPGEPVTRVRGPAPSARPAPEPLAPEELASPRVASIRDRRSDAAGERRERPRISARVAAAPAPEAAPLAVAATDVAILDQAIDLIIARSGELVQRIDPAGKLPVDTILDHGRKTIETVSDLLQRGTSPGLRRISTGLGDVLDLILLMQLEKGHAPADDTLTLILQIRRDLETLRAA